MSSFPKILCAIALATAFLNPRPVSAAEPRTLSCSVSINYSLNGAIRAPYAKDFIVRPGETFEDDFSTFTRFRIFDASTRVDNGKTVIVISYYNDVGVFDAVDLTTEMKINNEDGETTSGTHTYYTSLGIAGAHQTKYTLSCARLKD